MKARMFTLMLLLAAVWLSPLNAQQSQYLTILHLNDTHSNLMAGTPRSAQLEGQRGGISRVATIISQEMAGENPCMLLHAGDASMGDVMHVFPAGNPSDPRIPDLEILAGLGLTAMAAGNHEFDFGSLGLVAALNNSLGMPAAFPLLSANIKIPADPTEPTSALAAWIQPSMIKSYPGFTVGIIGLTTPMANYLSDPLPVSFEEDPAVIAGIVYQTAAALRDGGCNYVILLSHMGMAADKALAANVPGIDLVIGGHDHLGTKHPAKVTNPLGEVVSIVQTEGFYNQIGRLELKLHNGNISINKYDLIDIDAKVQEAPTIKAIVAGIAGSIESVPGAEQLFSPAIAMCTHPVTERATELMRPGHHDTHVGNLVTDAYQNTLNVDIGLEPGGSTAQPLYPGPIIAADVFRMIGYGANKDDGLGYHVVTFALSGYDLMVGLETALADIQTDDEMLLQVSSNLKYYYDPSQPVGSRLQAVYFRNQPLDPAAIYTIGTNWMVAQYLEMLNQMQNLGITILDYQETEVGEFGLVLNYIMSQQSIGSPRTPGRIVAASQMTAMNPSAPPPMAKIHSAGPNPFSEQSILTFETADSMPLVIKVYDTVGREIAVLRDGMVQAGMHSVVFSAVTLPPGMYFCRMFLPDGSVQSVKMVKSR
ncbi:MAG: 5'-nucleotidase C-terminal domain-containing protein [Bacteroidota bacterium]